MKRLLRASVLLVGLAALGLGSGSFGAGGARLSGGFWLGRTEVTQAQYAAIAGTIPSEFKSAGQWFNLPWSIGVPRT